MNENQPANNSIIHESQLVPGIIKPRHLAASTIMKAGDIYYVNASGIFQRLAPGANGTKLTIVNGIPAWV